MLSKVELKGNEWSVAGLTVKVSGNSKGLQAYIDEHGNSLSSMVNEESKYMVRVLCECECLVTFVFKGDSKEKGHISICPHCGSDDHLITVSAGGLLSSNRIIASIHKFI